MHRWWREWEVWALALLVGAIYLTRLTDPPLTGEEARRGQIAREMMRSGDWVVPRQQGIPFLSRPPVQNWLIALVAAARGGVDLVAIRLPSAVATVLSVLLIYGYCRTFLSRLGALSAAAAYPTMGHVIQVGWQGETEPMYTLMVSGSLLLWRWADAQGRPAIWGWCAGYALAALGMLTKGPQAPVYFAGGVGLFLLLRGRWRDLLRWPHFVGLAIFLAGWMAWELPFFWRVGSESAWRMFVGDVALRWEDKVAPAYWKHLLSFPVEVAVCMLPWSVLLFPYLRRDFRAGIGSARDHLQFLVCSAGFAFLTCWLMPGAKNRYFAPLYPCIAPLIGLVVERCHEAVAGSDWAKFWGNYLKGVGGVMLAIAAWVAVATALGWGPARGAQPPRFAVVYVLAVAALGALVFWSSGRGRTAWHWAGVLSIATFVGFSFVGVVFNVLVALKGHRAEDIAQLKQSLPEGTRLVSIGPVDHDFAYCWEDPIGQLSCPPSKAEREADWTYFCANEGPERAACDFPYEVVAVISIEAYTAADSPEKVLVGRRLSAPAPSRRP